MYTGAFAFPDTASLELSQPALNLSAKSAATLQHVTASKAAVQGKEAKAAPAAAKHTASAASNAKAAKPTATTASNDKAATTKDGVSASSGGSPSGRVLPSGWKRKKASPLPEEPAGASIQKPADAAASAAAPAAGIALFVCAIVLWASAAGNFASAQCLG